MLSPDEIARQHERLNLHRATLAVYLQQHAIFGPTYVPPHVLHGINAARAAIGALKTTLRAQGVPVDDHPDDTALPTTPERLPTTRGAVLRMIKDYTEVFGGRDAELAALDAFLAQDAQPYALLLAPTGRGKIALLIQWVVRVQARPGWPVLFVPISKRYQTADATNALQMLAQSLAAVHGELERFSRYTQTPDQLRPLIAEYLRRAPPDRRLLVVLDGLDEAVGWSVGRDLFPHTTASRIKIVAAVRELAHRSRADWLADLGWRAKQTATPALPALAAAVADIPTADG